MRPIRVAAAVACAGALATTVVLAPSASAAPAYGSGDGDYQGRTTVVLNPKLVPTLLALKIRRIAPGAIIAPGGVVQATFPVTEVYGKVIQHAGGLGFNPVTGGTLRITDFNVDLNTGYLNAKTRVNGMDLPGRVNIFKLGPVQPINGAAPACKGTPAGLTLTPQAAGALGAPSAAGAFVGDACVVVLDSDN